MRNRRDEKHLTFIFFTGNLRGRPLIVLSLRLAQRAKECGKIIRQRAVQLHIPSVPRVAETDNPRMQALAVQSGRLTASPIHRIPGDGMPQIRHMHPNLMRAACFQLDADMRIARIAGKHS